MAEIVADELEVCVDCAQLIANGSTEGLTDSQIEDIEIGLNRIEGHWTLTYNPETEDDYICFSRRQCDGCLSYLGGSRFRAAVLN